MGRADLEYGEVLLTAPIALAASGDIVAAPGASKRIVVTAVVLSKSTSGTVTFRSGTTNLSGAIDLNTQGGLTAVGTRDDPVLVCAPNETLNAVISAGSAAGWVTYFVEAIL